MLRNKLAENAKRILNTKSFDDGFKAVSKKSDDAAMQSKMLKESGFDAAASLKRAQEEPANYQTYEATGQAGFTYARNPKVEKVTKTDPAIKIQQDKKMRYNIITGSLQSWY